MDIFMRNQDLSNNLINVSIDNVNYMPVKIKKLMEKYDI